MALVELDLVVEDGTGFADANTYIDIAYADEYHRLRNNTAWEDADTEPDKVAAVIRATAYVDIRFCYVGSRLVDGQALQFPRDWAIDVDGFDQSEIVPEVVKQATAEYALRVLGTAGLTNLLPDPTIDDDTGKFVTLKRERLGPLEEETRFSEDRSRSILRPYPTADRLLLRSGLVIVSGGRTIRA